MGDLNGLSQQQIEERHKEYRPDLSDQDRREIVAFWCEIDPGDMIVARAGRKKVANVGYVKGRPVYNPERGAHRLGATAPNGTVMDYSANFLPMHWTNRGQDFGRIVFNMSTVCQLRNPVVRNWVEGWFTTPSDMLPRFPLRRWESTTP
jgi:hypothetical protein